MEQPRVHVSVVLEDSEGILMVKEGEAEAYGKWNLPGGHVEQGESVTSAGLREVREETGLEADLTSLVGVFVSRGAIRFVMRGHRVSGSEVPGDDILAVGRFHLEDLEALSDSALDGPHVLRAVFTQLAAKVSHPLNVLIEGIS